MAIVLGAALLILSDRSNPTLGVFGVICFVGGGIVLVRGLSKERVQKRATTATLALSDHGEEIDGLLKEGRSLSEIALDCQQRFGISADSMLIVATLRLRELLTSDQPHLREIAERTVAAQTRDVSLTPEQVLGRLHEDGVALHCDETLTAFVMPPSLRDGLNGDLVLTSSYLFLLVRKESGDEALVDMFRDLPMVGRRAMVVGILQGVGEQYKNPFREKRAKKLAVPSAGSPRGAKVRDRRLCYPLPASPPARPVPRRPRPGKPRLCWLRSGCCVWRAAGRPDRGIPSVWVDPSGDGGLAARGARRTRVASMRPGGG
ncbi:MAG: hypothetical protein WEG40_12095 [Candidatus Rokuibacteriota bacterium]